MQTAPATAIPSSATIVYRCFLCLFVLLLRLNYLHGTCNSNSRGLRFCIALYTNFISVSYTSTYLTTTTTQIRPTTSPASSSRNHLSFIYAAFKLLGAGLQPNEKQTFIKSMFSHAWKAYKLHAWGHDHLHPISRTYDDWFHVGLTMLDSLDTMYIMGMEKGKLSCCSVWRFV